MDYILQGPDFKSVSSLYVRALGRSKKTGSPLDAANFHSYTVQHIPA